jgi:2-methylcitrate dehydratase
MSLSPCDHHREVDAVLLDISEYVCASRIDSPIAYQTAHWCLLDSLGCAFEALSDGSCARLLGPIVPDAVLTKGARVPGTGFVLDPVTAAFNIGCLIRWLELNDAFTGGGHPSDNIGGILAASDYLSCRRGSDSVPPPLMHDVFTWIIKAYEIQGVISIGNGFAERGLGFDHSALGRIATAAVVTRILGGEREQVVNAVSNAFADGLPLKVFRQAPNAGTRKCWAGADATSRGVRLALLAMRGEMGYPSVLTAKKYGLYDAYFAGRPFRFERGYGSYVIENIIFKSTPTGLHSQSAVECAVRLHPHVKSRLDHIASIKISTQRAMMEIMDKRGILVNEADRDHCAQYVIAVGMIYGRLTHKDFSGKFAADPRIDALRGKMEIVEDPRYTRDAYDPLRRSSANAIEVVFKDGSRLPKVEVEYPSGHYRCRSEGIPMVQAKFLASVEKCFSLERQREILDVCLNQAKLERLPVHEFMDLLAGEAPKLVN